MIIADTSVWIEFLKGNPKITESFSKLLEQGNVFAMECVFGELLQGVRNKHEKEVIVNFWQNLPKIPQENLWIQAGIFSAESKSHSKGVGLIDLVIILGARSQNFQIWTSDKKLQKVLSGPEIFEG